MLLDRTLWWGKTRPVTVVGGWGLLFINWTGIVAVIVAVILMIVVVL